MGRNFPKSTPFYGQSKERIRTDDGIEMKSTRKNKNKTSEFGSTCSQYIQCSPVSKTWTELLHT